MSTPFPPHLVTRIQVTDCDPFEGRDWLAALLMFLSLTAPECEVTPTSPPGITFGTITLELDRGNRCYRAFGWREGAEPEVQPFVGEIMEGYPSSDVGVVNQILRRFCEEESFRYLIIDFPQNIRLHLCRTDSRTSLQAWITGTFVHRPTMLEHPRGQTP